MGLSLILITLSVVPEIGFHLWSKHSQGLLCHMCLIKQQPCIKK